MKKRSKARKVTVSTRMGKLEKAVKSILDDVDVIKTAIGIPTEKPHKIGFASPTETA